MIALNIAPGVDVSEKDVRESRVFQEWAKRAGNSWRGLVAVKHADRYQGIIRALMVVIIEQGYPYPVLSIWRPPVVNVLVVISNGRRWSPEQSCVLVKQHRPAIGSYVFANPTGERGWDEDPLDAAEREVREELDLDHPDFQWLDRATTFTYNRLTLDPLRSSPSLTSESVDCFRLLIEPRGPRKQRIYRRLIDLLNNRQTGSFAENEVLRLRAVPVTTVRAFVRGQNDGDLKTLYAIESAGL